MVHYVYRNDELDDIGERIADMFNSGATSRGETPIDAEKFLEFFLEATIDYADLCLNNEILGLTTLVDGPVRLFDKASGSAVARHYSRGTVVLNNDHVENDIEARQRFTLVHEGAHMLLHSWLGSGEASKSLTVLAEADSEFFERPRATDRNESEQEKWHEQQANRLAAAILMPKSALVSLAARYEYVDPDSGVKFIFPGLEMKVAEVFQVSTTAARFRLDSLGIS